MRSLIILVLAVLLVGGARLSKPSKQSFRKMVRQHYQARSDSAADKLLVEARVDAYMRSLEYRDKFLYAAMERDGKRISTGVFARWFGGKPEGIDDTGLLPKLKTP